VDGEQVIGQGGFTGAPLNASGLPFLFAGGGPGLVDGNRTFMSLDEIMIFDRALQPSELQQIIAETTR
jgi:hypothetical protein